MKQYLNKRVRLTGGNFKGKSACTTGIVKNDDFPFKIAIKAILDNGREIFISRPEHFRVIGTTDEYLANKWHRELKKANYTYDEMIQVFKTAKEMFNKRKQNK